MITNPELLKKFEDDFIRQNDMTVQEKFNLIDSMFEYADSLGALSTEDTTGHLDTLIKTVKVFRDATEKSAKSYKGTRKK